MTVFASELEANVAVRVPGGVREQFPNDEFRSAEIFFRIR